MKKHYIFITAVFLMSASLTWAAEAPITFSSIDTELKNDYALNSYRDYYVTGIGAGAQANFELTDVENLGFFTAIDYYYGISKTIWADSFQDLSFLIGSSYTFLPNEQVSIIPELGYGFSVHLIPGDVNRDGTDDVSVYFDQMLSFAVKFIYPLNKDFSIYMTPELKLLIESNNNAILAGYNLGARINL